MGYAHEKGQKMNLVEDCMLEGGIIHEFLHSLGFSHMHNVPNRDQYINIHWENVLPGMEVVFREKSDSDVTDFNLGYDYKSIMQYREDSFSRNGKPTMTAKAQGFKNMGDLSGLSEIDIAKINIAYNC